MTAPIVLVFRLTGTAGEFAESAAAMRGKRRPRAKESFILDLWRLVVWGGLSWVDTWLLSLSIWAWCRMEYESQYLGVEETRLYTCWIDASGPHMPCQVQDESWGIFFLHRKLCTSIECYYIWVYVLLTSLLLGSKFQIFSQSMKSNEGMLHAFCVLYNWVGSTKAFDT